MRTCMYAHTRAYAHTLMHTHMHIIVCITAHLNLIKYGRWHAFHFAHKCVYAYTACMRHMHVCAHTHVYVRAHHCACNGPLVFSYACVSAVDIHCVLTHRYRRTNPHVCRRANQCVYKRPCSLSHIWVTCWRKFMFAHTCVYAHKRMYTHLHIKACTGQCPR